MNKKIVIDNLALIYKVMKDMHCNTDEEQQDEYFFAGLMGLIEASKRYDETKGKSSYLYKAIKMRIFNVFRTHIRPKRYNSLRTVSLNTIINENAIDNELLDNIKGSYEFESEVINKVYVRHLLSKLKERRYKTFLVLYYGIDTPELTMKEIAEKYNVTYQFVQCEIKRGLEILRKVVESEKN